MITVTRADNRVKDHYNGFVVVVYFILFHVVYFMLFISYSSTAEYTCFSSCFSVGALV